MPTPANIRILVVDDSSFMRKAIARMVEDASGLEVIGTARDGLEAVKMAEELQPDIVTLDIEMPVMDGLTALKQVLRVCEARVLMVSSLTTAGSDATLRAMKLGAADFIAKGQSQVCTEIFGLESAIIEKIRAIAQQKKPTLRVDVSAESTSDQPMKLRASDFDLIVIGSSTGGPPVLEDLLTPLPAQFPVPIVIAQHMPETFTATLAKRLDARSGLNVLHGEAGMPLQGGQGYILPGGKNTIITGKPHGVLKLSNMIEHTDWPYKPSVNALFDSAAKVCGSRTLGMMLTGMGEDGLIGSRELKAKRGKLIAQDHDSCVVYGMPKAITQAGLVDASLPPEMMIESLLSLSSARAA